MPRTHADSNCSRVATLYTSPTPNPRTNPSSPNNTPNFTNFRTYMILRATSLQKAIELIPSPTHVNKQAVEHSECNRERVDVARCLLRSAPRSFCRKKFSKRVLTTSPRGDLLLSGILANGNKAVLFTIGHLRGFSTSFDFFLLRGEARETHTHHS